MAIGVRVTEPASIIRWESVSSYVEDALPVLNAQPWATDADRDRYATIGRLAVEGCPNALARSRDYSVAFDAEHAHEDRVRWDYHAIGSSMSPARYAMGHPAMMRRRMASPTDYKRCTIVYCTGIAAGAMYSPLASRRGELCTGLIARLMSEGVDVDLYVTEDGAVTCSLARLAKGKPWESRLSYNPKSQDYIQVVRVDTRPLNMAQVAYLLSTREVFSSFMLPAGIAGFFGPGASSWPRTLGRNGENARGWEAVARESLGLGPRDLYFGAALMQSVEARETPEQWITRQVANVLSAA